MCVHQAVDVDAPADVISSGASCMAGSHTRTCTSPTAATATIAVKLLLTGLSYAAAEQQQFIHGPGAGLHEGPSGGSPAGCDFGGFSQCQEVLWTGILMGRVGGIVGGRAGLKKRLERLESG